MIQCPKIPKSNLISKYISYTAVCFILYIVLVIIGIKKDYNLHFSYYELLFLIFFLIFNWFYLLSFLIIFLFFNIIRIIFTIGVLIQCETPLNDNLFKFIYYSLFIILDIITIKILFTIRKEGRALLLQQNEGSELEDIPNDNYYNSKKKTTETKKGYIPFSGKGTVVG